MRNEKKRYDIERIVKNADLLSNPQIYECFIYDCEDPDGFAEVESEIIELGDMLPGNISLLDLPDIICGNKKTKIYGKATCSLTNGHMILESNLPQSVIFDSVDEAEKKGYRPCAKCMRNEYLEWKSKKEAANNGQYNKT